MIRSNELRQGNWIRYTGHPVRVTEILKNNQVKTENHINGTLDVYDGIDLTPEILELLGFKWDINLHEYKNDLWPMFYLSAADDYSVIWITSGDSDQALISIKYVHQLQNIFYFTKNQTELPTPTKWPYF